MSQEQWPFYAMENEARFRVFFRVCSLHNRDRNPSPPPPLFAAFLTKITDHHTVVKVSENQS